MNKKEYMLKGQKNIFAISFISEHIFYLDTVTENMNSDELESGVFKKVGIYYYYLIFF